VADVFDALTSDRVYRKAFTVEEAVEMMLEQRGQHFDPVLLDAFMEVLGRSGPDAREQVRADPGELTEGILETFATALQRGDGETAEGAIAQAIEDGVPAAMVHDEVIEPALRRVIVLKDEGQIDASGERLAMGIAKRVLATLRRYMLSSEAPDDVLERIDQSVSMVNGLLTEREHAVG
jgi:CheY-like chemotaxis protein